MNRNKKGFTIVELVIVIAILAILAAVLIPTFASLVKKANEANAQTEAKNLITEMLANILGRGDEAADLVIVTKKGNEAYVYGYDVSAGQFIAYKDNPVTLPEGNDFYGQAEKICENLKNKYTLKSVDVSGTWREKVTLNAADVAALGFKADETAVFANYDIVSLSQTVTAVNTVDELKTAINNGGYIVLSSNVTISESLEIPTNKNISVDLNGKKISSENPVFSVKGTLEINGTGTITSDSNAIEIYGGKCTLNGGDVFSTGKNRAVVYLEQNDTGVPTFIMNGGSLTLDRKDGMGFSLGTNNVSSSPSVAVINGGVLNGAIYWPISGSLTIGRVGGSNSDVTVSGKMALLACCGTVTINCGTFNSTMDGTDSHDTTEWVQENYTRYSGIPGYTGDAVMLVTGRSSGYVRYPLNVVINDGVFISDGVEYGLRIVDCNNGEQEVNITINGGTYTGGELGSVDYSAAKAGCVVDNRTNK